MRLLPRLACCAWIAAAPWSGQAAEQSDDALGQWHQPPPNGKPWKHEGTGLSYPARIQDYGLVGELRFKQGGGGFIRYENAIDRARADIFFIPHPPADIAEADARAALLAELDSAIKDMQAMTNQGRYKNLVLEEPEQGAIPLWPTGELPLAARALTAVKIADLPQGPQEVKLRQWIGVTRLKGHLITIRHTHPAATGESGDGGANEFIGAMFQIIKDPPLRAQVRQMVQEYLASPLSPEGESAAAVVLAYIEKTPFLAVPIPIEALAPWLDHFKKIAPGTEMQLLRAFVIGSAQAALNESDPDTALTAGARQFLLIYQELTRRNPTLALPAVADLAAAVQRGEAPAFIKRLNAATK